MKFVGFGDVSVPIYWCIGEPLEEPIEKQLRCPTAIGRRISRSWAPIQESIEAPGPVLIEEEPSEESLRSLL